jgi:hypothetical protein
MDGGHGVPRQVPKRTSQRNVPTNGGRSNAPRSSLHGPDRPGLSRLVPPCPGSDFFWDKAGQGRGKEFESANLRFQMAEGARSLTIESEFRQSRTGIPACLPLSLPAKDGPLTVRLGPPGTAWDRINFSLRTKMGGKMAWSGCGDGLLGYYPLGWAALGRFRKVEGESGNIWAHLEVRPTVHKGKGGHRSAMDPTNGWFGVSD